MSLDITGDRVRHARLLRRLTNKTVSDHMGWAPATQTRLERSEKKVLDTATVAQLAQVLRVSADFLCAPALPPLSANRLLFRAPKITTQQEKDFLAELIRFCGEFTEWLDSKHRLPPVKIPQLEHNEDPIQAAHAVRAALDCETDQPIHYLMHTAERSGIVVVVRTPPGNDPDVWNKAGDASVERPDRGERHFGCSAWTGSYAERPMVIIRSIESWERTRWTVAHELGHIALHHQMLDDNAELAASVFASELLAPAKEIVKELPKHATLRELVPLKMKWGISLGALILHLKRCNLITCERADTLSRQLYTRCNSETGRTWGIDEPGWNERSVERPRVLSRWAERCVGTSDPEAIYPLTSFWPLDLLRSILTAQRHGNVMSSPNKDRGGIPGAIVPLFSGPRTHRAVKT